MALKLRKILSVTPAAVKAAKPLRIKSIEDGIALPAGPSRANMKLTTLWQGQGYVVGVGKPGKETERVGASGNANDMWPFIKTDNGEDATKSASFKDIFLELEHMQNTSPHALELLGCLFVRSSLMLDHIIQDNRVIYEPPKEIVEEIKKYVTTIFGVPLEVFLQYINTIALNEDVKYITKGRARNQPYSPGAGRPNNLSTCAHLIAVLLGRASLVDFAYGFSQMRGVSGIGLKKAKMFFPMLDDAVKTDESELE